MIEPLSVAVETLTVVDPLAGTLTEAGYVTDGAVLTVTLMVRFAVAVSAQSDTCSTTFFRAGRNGAVGRDIGGNHAAGVDNIRDGQAAGNAGGRNGQIAGGGFLIADRGDLRVRDGAALLPLNRRGGNLRRTVIEDHDDLVRAVIDDGQIGFAISIQVGHRHVKPVAARVETVQDGEAPAAVAEAHSIGRDQIRNAVTVEIGGG